MEKTQQLITLRTRKLGILIADARSTLKREAVDCAKAMGVPIEQFVEIENGSQAPTLPEIEALAFLLKIPIEYFWGNEPYSKQSTKDNPELVEKTNLFQLRNRIIATRLRMGRTQIQLSTLQLAEKTGLDEETIIQYESIQTGIPLPHLELLAQALDITINELLDKKGPVGIWQTQQTAIKDFVKLPLELQQFICQPVNQPYLELAQRLSLLPADRLRSIAESLLEITY